MVLLDPLSAPRALLVHIILLHKKHERIFMLAGGAVFVGGLAADTWVGHLFTRTAKVLAAFAALTDSVIRFLVIHTSATVVIISTTEYASDGL